MVPPPRRHPGGGHGRGHNTYGERHVYLLHPDDRGRAEADKDFYVSPFLPVTGRYHLHLPEPGSALRLSITLHLDGRTVLVLRVAEDADEGGAYDADENRTIRAAS